MMVLTLYAFLLFSFMFYDFQVIDGEKTDRSVGSSIFCPRETKLNIQFILPEPTKLSVD